jgi:hypothetical protein
MVIVIPLKATQRLIDVARSRQLSLPIPLSSACASYLSQEEMDTILETLASSHDKTLLTANLMRDLQQYRDQANPVIPCEQA